MASKREAQLLARVHQCVTACAESLGLDLLDVDFRGQGPRRVLKVIADVADLDPSAGLDVDDIARLSRAISDELDAGDIVPGSYTLEVSSPGVDRPLRTARDFRRNLGRDVAVSTNADSGAADLTGVVAAVEDESVTFRVDDADVTLQLRDIASAKVVLPW
ncbi:MAG: ribosome maturation factor RimP [Nitriliruptoraceae bacterium]